MANYSVVFINKGFFRSFFSLSLLFDKIFTLFFVFYYQVRRMKANLLISVGCALLLGYLCANFLFSSYQKTSTTFDGENKVFFLQYGAYQREMPTDIQADPHIEVEQDGNYYVYVGITTDYDNAKKIQDFYEQQGVELYIKEEQVDSDEFFNELSQYDILLESTDTDEEITSVLATILASYEEFVLKR